MDIGTPLMWLIKNLPQANMYTSRLDAIIWMQRLYGECELAAAMKIYLAK